MKPATAAEWTYTRGLLVEYFAESTPIDRISAGDARDWRAWLRSRPVGEAKPPEDDPKGDPVQKRMSDGTVRKHTRNAKSIFRAAPSGG